MFDTSEDRTMKAARQWVANRILRKCCLRCNATLGDDFRCPKCSADYIHPYTPDFQKAIQNRIEDLKDYQRRRGAQGLAERSN